MAVAQAVATSETEATGPRNVVETEVTFPSGDVTLSATTYEPERVPLPPEEEGKKPKKVKEGDPEAPPRAYALLVHGLLSDRREFGTELPKRLAQAGIGVLALDLKGHGKSGGPRGIVSVASIEEDILAARAYLSGREEQWDLNPQQWAVIGHSLGAVGALHAGYKFHQQDEIIAIAPPRKIREEIGPLERLGYALAYRMTGAKDAPAGEGPSVPYRIRYTDIILDPHARQRAARLDFLGKRIPLANYPTLMGFDGEAIARNLLNPNVTVIAAAKDRVVSNGGTRAIYEALPTSKQWWFVENSGHSVFMDAKAPELIAKIVGHLQPRLGYFPEVRDGSIKR